MNVAYLEDDKFGKYCIWALSVHFGILVLAVVIDFVLGFNFISRTRPKVEIIQSAVRVDVVEMPKYTVQELKKMQVAPMPEAPEEVTGEVKPEEPEKKVEEAPKVDLSNILNTLSKKDVKPQPTKKVKGKQEIDKTKLKTLLLEGNKVSKGSSIVGDSYAKEESKFNTYMATLPDYIRPFWKLPTYLLENENLNCRIKIFIDSDGKIVKSEIIESSGEAEFDRKALQAIKDTKSLPPPEKAILARVSSGKIILGFPL